MTSLAFTSFICKWRHFHCPLCVIMGRMKRGQADEVTSLPRAAVRAQPQVSVMQETEPGFLTAGLDELKNHKEDWME